MVLALRRHRHDERHKHSHELRGLGVGGIASTPEKFPAGERVCAMRSPILFRGLDSSRYSLRLAFVFTRWSERRRRHLPDARAHQAAGSKLALATFRGPRTSIVLGHQRS